MRCLLAALAAALVATAAVAQHRAANPAASPAANPAIAAPAAAAPLRLPAMEAAIARGDYRRIEAVLVLRRGQPVYEAYFGQTTAHTRIDARSAGKSVTALAVGVAIDEGRIPGVGERVADAFAAELHDSEARAWFADIRVDDLLGMRSPLACNDWDDASPGNEERMYPTHSWTGFALAIPRDPAFVRDAAGHGRFAYCTAGAFLLGQMVERATAMRFDRFVEARLFAPLGIEGAIWRASPAGEIQSGGQLSLRARDFAALGQLVLDNGMAGGRRLVSAAWIARMLEPAGRATPEDRFGYLWWLRDFRPAGGGAAHAGAYMSGNGGNKVVVLRSLDAVVVVLSTNYNARGMHQATTGIIEAHILPALLAHAPGGAAAP